MRRGLILLFILFMSGCIGVQQEVIKKEQFYGDEKITYIIPKDEGLDNAGFLKGLYLKRTKKNYGRYPGTSISRVAGIDIEYDPSLNMILCTEYNGEIFHATRKGREDSEYSSYVQYQVQVEVEEREDSYIVAFIPTSKEVIRGCGPSCITHYDIPGFTEERLIEFLSNAIVRFNVEIDSPYDTESTYANFRRLLKEETFRQPYKDEVTGKIYKSAFYLPKDEKQAKLFVEVFPYRNGSKAVINIEMPVSVDPVTRVSDVGNEIADVKAELDRIVND